jgi:hypothetical protein
LSGALGVYQRLAKATNADVILEVILPGAQPRPPSSARSRRR